jgi:hypothetical protein
LRLGATLGAGRRLGDRFAGAWSLGLGASLGARRRLGDRFAGASSLGFGASLGAGSKSEHRSHSSNG